MLPLIRTLFAIVLLRKGPADIPRSAILFALIVGLWLFSALITLALIPQVGESDFFLGLFSTLIGMACYASLVVLAGRSERLLQTISAIIGCGALISVAYAGQYALLMPFVGEVATGLVASLTALWSIPVEGHIIARAIDRHWYIGIAIAIMVFTLQLIMFRLMMQTS